MSEARPAYSMSGVTSMSSSPEDFGKRRREVMDDETTERAQSSSCGTSEGEPFEIEDLPRDVLFTIVNQLAGKDLAKLVMTSKKWGKVARDETLWSMVIKKHENWTSAIEKSRPQLSWKQIYVNLYCLENAMCSRCFKRSRLTHICREDIEQELSKVGENCHCVRLFRLRFSF